MTAATDKPVKSPGTEFQRGIRKVLPLLLGVAPFGMIYGVIARQLGLSVAATQSMSLIVFAGSAQFIATQLIREGIPTLVLVLTLFIVNLRHALYSASIAPYLNKLSLGWKALLAYLLVDEAYIVSITHYQEEGSEGNQHWFFLGTGLSLWLTWQLSTAAGIFLGAVVPASWELDFALPLTFISLLVVAIKDRPGVIVAVVSCVVTLFVFALPYKLGLLVAVTLGIAAGMLAEKRR